MAKYAKSVAILLTGGAMPKWTRSQRRRYQDELQAGSKPDVRDIFLTPHQKAQRKAKAAKVAARLAGKQEWVWKSGPGGFDE